MKRKKTYEGVIIAAYFMRYGYFIAMIPIMAIIGSIWAFWAMCALYGALMLIGRAVNSRTLYCACQNADHQKMTPQAGGFLTPKMRRDSLMIGLFFIAIGIAGGVATYFKL